ncbi:MAG: LacI family DNA-binding transcriptional regulator [Chloroflexota bacterium]|jgi:LacI family transcriptional regulator/LacI family repressor for deo operon, udp, cdd, tsx, nupC, and nupG
MPTIKDVAKRAGVSVTTVSRVLNHHPHVTGELTERVLAAIDELNYRPSRVAQRLRATHSRLVGVVFSDITNPFYIHVLRGIEHVLSLGGSSVLIGNADANTDREASFIRLMQTEDVAGLIIAPTREDSPALASAIQEGLAVVVIDRRMRNVEVDTVVVNNFEGSLKAIHHLIQLGHTRIGVVSGPLHLTTGRERYAGYLQAMTDAGLRVDSSLTCFGDYRQSSGYELTQQLIRLPDPPTAMFVANNQMTIGALNAIHEAGRNIPSDIAVVGFDDLSWAISLNPPLTTVAQPAFEIGVNAAHLLLERIADPLRPTHTVVLETELIVRASCGSPSRFKSLREEVTTS